MRRILNLAPQIVVRDAAILSYDYENAIMKTGLLKVGSFLDKTRHRYIASVN